MRFLKAASSRPRAPRRHHTGRLLRICLAIGLIATLPAPATAEPAPTRAAAKTAARAGPLQPGAMYWGAAGHRDQGGPYTAIPLTRQIADLKAIFGSTPNTVVYRALGDGMVTGFGRDVVQLQAAGIIPIVMVATYPPWQRLADERAAFDWAYTTVSRSVRSAPTNQVWEIGNEWILQAIWKQRAEEQPDLSVPGYRATRAYPLYRGAMAGAVAAIRDVGLPSAQIVGSVLAGWTYQNLAIALAEDLAHYSGRDLTWDFTAEHWYRDAQPDGNRMGDPDAFADGASVYRLQNSPGKPIFFTEFGSSNGGDAARNATAGGELVSMMENFAAHRRATPTEPGVAGGAVYMLYQMPGVQTDYFLYSYTRGATATLSAQGEAVKRWIARHPPGP